MLLSLLLLAAGGCADAFVMPGNHEAIIAPGLGRRMIRVNGKSVDVWTTRSPAARMRDPIAYVLFFVGNGDRAERWLQVVADGWGERPVVVWGMNYPGSGGSEGPPRLPELAPDALAVFDAARG